MEYDYGDFCFSLMLRIENKNCSGDAEQFFLISF